MTFKDKIDIFMEKNGYKNLKQLSNDCKIPYTTLRDFYEKKDVDNSKTSTIRKLSLFMKCTMDYLSYDDLIYPNQTKTDENFADNTYTTMIYTDDEYKLQLQTDKPFETLSEEEREKIVQQAMDELFEYKRNLKNKE